MNTNIRKWNRFLSLTVLVAGIFVSYAVVAFAQTDVAGEPTEEEIAARGITFPIPELGNCGDKQACRAYCEDSAHVETCVKFAKEHGLMNEKEAALAEKFGKRVKEGSGPGGCRTPRECQSFCANIQNMEACVKFADEQGFTDTHVEQGKKILAHIKSGGTMPGGCTSKDSCQAYCGDFSHAEECFEFSKRAGIGQTRGPVAIREGSSFEDAPSPEQFEKLIGLVKRGETPGGCTSKDSCETYCRSGDHFEECVTFGEKLGFIKPDEAAMIRKSGGKGPGGCNSQDTCSAYCNDSAHHDECFAFAEEHGFIPPEEVKRAKEGFVQLRAGLEQAPPEVASCLKSNLGNTIIEDIQSGKLTPGPEIGSRVRGCFEKFGHRGNPGDLLKDAPPEVVSCIKEKLGERFETIRAGKEEFTPEIGDTLRVCFEKMRFFGGEGGGPGFGSAPGGPGAGPGGMMQSRGFFEFLKSAPPEVASCLQEKLGDRYAALKSGDTSAMTPDLPQVMRGCFESFQPREHMMDARGVYDAGAGGGMQGMMSGQISQAIEMCMRKVMDAARAENETADTEAIRKECASEIQKRMPQTFPSQDGQPRSGPMNPGMMMGMPVHILECVKASGVSISGNVEEMKNSEAFRDAVVNCNEKLRGTDARPGGIPGVQPSPFMNNPSGGDVQTHVAECVKSAMTASGGAGDMQAVTKQCLEQFGGNVSGQVPVSNQMYQTAPPSSQTPPMSSPPPGGYTTDPATGCAQYGGTWDGSTCVMPNAAPPPSGFPPSSPPPSYNPDPSTSCAQYGGTWDGFTCVMSNTAPTGGYQSGSGGTYQYPPPPGGTGGQPPPSGGPSLIWNVFRPLLQGIGL